MIKFEKLKHRAEYVRNSRFPHIPANFRTLVTYSLSLTASHFTAYRQSFDWEIVGIIVIFYIRRVYDIFAYFFYNFTIMIEGKRWITYI